MKNNERVYKTVEQAKQELTEINPSLVDKYEILSLDDEYNLGVQLIRQGNKRSSIVSHNSSYGGRDGLYEIYPDIDGAGFSKTYRTGDDVAGWLTLKEAVDIAEATENNSPELEKLIKKHFH